MSPSQSRPTCVWIIFDAFAPVPKTFKSFITAHAQENVLQYAIISAIFQLFVLLQFRQSWKLITWPCKICIFLCSGIMHFMKIKMTYLNLTWRKYKVVSSQNIYTSFKSVHKFKALCLIIKEICTIIGCTASWN